MNYKVEWDVSDIYTSEKDPKIEKDIKMIEKACSDFAKKYAKLNFTSGAQNLFKALKDYESLNEAVASAKPLWYFGLKTKLNSSDEVSLAHETKIDQRLTIAKNKLTFFELNIAKIPVKKQKVFLQDKKFSEYKYFLKKIFDSSKYWLSEKEEQLMSLMSQTSYSMWVDGNLKLTGKQQIEFKGEKMPLAKVSNIIGYLPKQERHDLQKDFNEKLQSISHFAEAEINAIGNYKKLFDELRKFKKPYSSTLLNYENDEKTIENLVTLVTKNFPISHRFYKLHAQLLGEKKLNYADRNVPIGEIKKTYPFDISVEIVKKAYEKFDPRFAGFLDTYLQNGQMDVYSKVGKAGGAFCWKTPGRKTFVLLNHTDNLNSVSTLGHEMGHAIHSELTEETQPIFYNGFPTSIAEVASTFFEQIVSDELESTLSQDDKIIFLHAKISKDVQCIFRQVACFNFELELHTRIRNDGQVSAEEIAKMMKKHFASYLGDAFELTDGDGYQFVNWPHIRSFFYVYSYAYGQMISKALYENWKKDATYAKKIEKFLQSGASVSPKDLFKSIGIDTSKPKFFEDSLKSIEKDIERLSKLSAKK